MGTALFPGWWKMPQAEHKSRLPISKNFGRRLSPWCAESLAAASCQQLLVSKKRIETRALLLDVGRDLIAVATSESDSRSTY